MKCPICSFETGHYVCSRAPVISLVADLEAKLKATREVAIETKLHGSIFPRTNPAFRKHYAEVVDAEIAAKLADKERGYSGYFGGRMSEPLKLHQTMDAKVWADDFNVVLVSKGEQPFAPGWLIGWFANAIMCGWDHAYWKLQPALDDARALLAKYEEVNAALVEVLLHSRPDSTWADPDYAAFYKRFTLWEKERESALSSAAALRGEKGEKEKSL